MEKWMKEISEQLSRSMNAKVTEEFIRVLLEAIQSGDFQMATTAPSFVNHHGRQYTFTRQFNVSYIPFREVTRLRGQVRSLEARISEAEFALAKIEDPRLIGHKEPDEYTQTGCLMNVAHEYLEKYREIDREAAR